MHLFENLEKDDTSEIFFFFFFFITHARVSA